MPRNKQTGKRSKANKPSRVKYNTFTRHENKIKKYNKQIKKLKKMKDRNPDSKVDRTIKELEEAKAKWYKTPT